MFFCPAEPEILTKVATLWQRLMTASAAIHADDRASYRKEAADDAWAQMQAWFKKYGVLS